MWAAIEHTRAQAALRKRETQFRSLFEAIDEAVFVLEPAPPRPDGLRDCRFVAMGKQAQTMSSRPDLTGQPIRNNFPDEDEAWYDIYQQVFESRTAIRLER